MQSLLDSSLKRTVGETTVEIQVESPEQYLEELVVDGTWADHADLLAMADACNVCLIVYMRNANGMQVTPQAYAPNQDTEAAPLKAVCLWYSGDHYEYLCPISPDDDAPDEHTPQMGGCTDFTNMGATLSSGLQNFELDPTPVDLTNPSLASSGDSMGGTSPLKRPRPPQGHQGSNNTEEKNKRKKKGK